MRVTFLEHCMLDQVQTSKSSSHLRDEVVKPAHRFVANPEKSRYGLVAVLLAFSVAIRFYQLGALNLWCDEDITTLAVKARCKMDSRNCHLASFIFVPC